MDDFSGNVWTPPMGMTSHAGLSIPEDMRFFAAPPPEIGRVLSAESSLTTTSRSLTQSEKLTVTGLSNLWWIGAILLVVLLLLLLMRLHPIVIAILMAWIGIVLCKIYYDFQTQQSGLGIDTVYQCSYVGDRGVAEFTLDRLETAAPKAQILRFETAENLFVSHCLRYRSKGGGSRVYTHTDYAYDWKQRQGRDFAIAGEHKHRWSPPEESNRWHLGHAAEAAWTQYSLPRSERHMREFGRIEFPITRQQWRSLEVPGSDDLAKIAVTPDCLELTVHPSGKIWQIPWSDLASVSSSMGDKFRFKNQHSSWGRGPKRYSAPYGDVANAKLLIHWLNQFSNSVYRDATIPQRPPDMLDEPAL